MLTTKEKVGDGDTSEVKITWIWLYPLSYVLTSMMGLKTAATVGFGRQSGLHNR